MGFEQALEQPVQALQADLPGRPACSVEHVADGAYRAGGAVSGVPMAGAKSFKSFFKHSLSRNFGGFEIRNREQALWKKLHGPSDTPHLPRLHGVRLQALAQHHFCGAPANVNHQAPFRRLREHAGHALVNQSGFFSARDHINLKTQEFGGALEKDVSVEGLSQGLRGHGAHLGLVKAGQPLAKSGQAFPAALHGLLVQVAVGVQACPLPHRFFDVFRALNQAVVEPADFKAKAVRAQINCGKMGPVLHEDGAAGRSVNGIWTEIVR